MDQAKKSAGGGFYEELEWLALRHKPCRIIFRNGASKTEITDQIREVFTIESTGWLRTGSGLEIRLLDLLEVDGKRPDNHC